jgi:hypothetical protein
MHRIGSVAAAAIAVFAVVIAPAYSESPNDQAVLSGLRLLEREGAPMQVVLPYFRARKVAVMTLRSEQDLQALKAQAGR